MNMVLHGYGATKYGKLWSKVKEKRVKQIKFWRPNNINCNGCVSARLDERVKKLIDRVKECWK